MHHQTKSTNTQSNKTIFLESEDKSTSMPSPVSKLSIDKYNNQIISTRKRKSFNNNQLLPHNSPDLDTHMSDSSKSTNSSNTIKTQKEYEET